MDACNAAALAFGSDGGGGAAIVAAATLLLLLLLLPPLALFSECGAVAEKRLI